MSAKGTLKLNRKFDKNFSILPGNLKQKPLHCKNVGQKTNTLIRDNFLMLTNFYLFQSNSKPKR